MVGKENLENYISNRHDGKENYCLLRYLCGTEILSAPFDIIMSVRITDLDIFPLQFWFHYHVLITDSRVVFYHISQVAQKAKLGFKLLLFERLNENLKQKHF